MEIRIQNYKIKNKNHNKKILSSRSLNILRNSFSHWDSEYNGKAIQTPSTFTPKKESVQTQPGFRTTRQSLVTPLIPTFCKIFLQHLQKKMQHSFLAGAFLYVCMYAWIFSSKFVVSPLFYFLNYFKINIIIYLFLFWLCQVLVATHVLLSWGQQAP